MDEQSTLGDSLGCSFGIEKPFNHVSIGKLLFQSTDNLVNVCHIVMILIEHHKCVENYRKPFRGMKTENQNPKNFIDLFELAQPRKQDRVILLLSLEVGGKMGWTRIEFITDFCLCRSLLSTAVDTILPTALLVIHFIVYV